MLWKLEITADQKGTELVYADFWLEQVNTGTKFHEKKNKNNQNVMQE